MKIDWKGWEKKINEKLHKNYEERIHLIHLKHRIQKRDKKIIKCDIH